MAQVCFIEPQTEKVEKLVGDSAAIEKSVPLIELGQSMGEIKEGDPLALSSAFWCAVQGTAMAFARDRTLPLPEASWFVDILRV